jgi:hypothetical protein
VFVPEERANPCACSSSTRAGWVDCAGRSSANATLTLNSNGAKADDPAIAQALRLKDD